MNNKFNNWFNSWIKDRWKEQGVICLEDALERAGDNSMDEVALEAWQKQQKAILKLLKENEQLKSLFKDQDDCVKNAMELLCENEQSEREIKSLERLMRIKGVFVEDCIEYFARNSEDNGRDF